MGKKVDAALVEAVKKSLKEDERLFQINNQKEQIAADRELTEKHESMTDIEKEAKYAKLNYEEMLLGVHVENNEETKKNLEQAFRDANIRTVNLKVPSQDGRGVVELAVMLEDFNLEKMLEYSKNYYEKMSEVIEPFIK